MAQNQVRLQLHALAYNLGSFLQALPEEDPQLVIYELAVPSNKDRCSCRSARPRRNLPIGRGHGQRRSVPPHPSRHTPTTTISGADMTFNQHAMERKRLDKCAQSAAARRKRCRIGSIASPSGLLRHPLAVETRASELTAERQHLRSDIYRSTWVMSVDDRRVSFQHEGCLSWL